ncbi:MAG: GTPase [Peptococcaceae bacterium]|nr:GTPase [Peptococcaceae bacterium]
MANKRVIIIGAGGRDFHNFNMYFRDNEEFEVVGFTAAAQVPDMDDRRYPAELAGKLYPKGIRIYPEADLGKLVKELDATDVVFAYSDVSYQHVMGLGAIAQAAGANYMMIGPKNNTLKSKKPVIAICASRTGAGKGQTTRRVIEILNGHGLKVVAVRHPMAYGDLVAQKVQRFAELSDLKKHNCTVEETEEYEPHVIKGNVIYAGVDYPALLQAAEQDPKGCDVIVWDGGNNDYPFFQPDLMFTVVDPHRPGHELAYYPGEICTRMADVIVINKIDSASAENIQTVRDNIAKINPDAIVVDTASPFRVDDPSIIKGKRVLVIEDGPTLTHGDMSFGVGYIAAKRFGAAEIVDPKPYAVGRIAEILKLYPQIGSVLPAIGYNPAQLKESEDIINSVDCDSIVSATPIDMARLITFKKPYTRVYYDSQEIGAPTFDDIIADFLKNNKIK